MTKMTPEEQAIADDFEKAGQTNDLMLPGCAGGSELPRFSLTGWRKISERARHDGISDLELIRRAITDYLSRNTAA